MDPKAAWIENDEEKKNDIMNLSEDVGHKNKQEGNRPLALPIRQFLSEVSVAGLKYSANLNIGPLRRLCWSVLVCFGIGFAIYQISEQARIYLSYPVTVKMNITDMPSLKFPTITVCNENIMNKSKILEFDPKGDLLWAFSEAFTPIHLNDAELDFDRVIEVFTEWKSENWGELYSTTQQNYRELLIDCSFDGALCNPRDLSDIETNAGKCLQFNANGNLTTQVVGNRNGLQLVLTADVENYNIPSSASAGYRIMIHHKSEVINNDVANKAILVNVNHHTQIKIQSEEIRRLPKPFGSCREEEEYQEYVYSKCSVLCFETYLLEHCGCTFPGSLLKNQTTCSGFIGATCIAPVMRKYYTEAIESYQCDCPPQCVEHVYPYQISAGAFSDYFIQWMQRVKRNRKFTREYMEKNVVILDVYFDSLKKTEMITQPAYTLLSLLCDIGGALGLILGSTVLTFFEIFDFCLVASSSVFCVPPARGRKTAEIKPE